MSSPKPTSFKEYLSTRQGQIFMFLILIAILVLAGALPKTLREQNAKRFAKPLFTHALPADSEAVQTYAEQQQADGVTTTFATIILRSSLSEDELLAFYSDTDYPPAKTGDTVTLQVLPVQEDALTVLKNAGYAKEGDGSYWYIYLYSSPMRN